MSIEDELRSLYGSIAVAPESERRVIATALHEPASRRRSAVVGAVLASAAVVAGALVLVAIRSSHSSTTPAAPVAAVIPLRTPGTINGAVLLAGRPDAGARVLIGASPNGAILDRLKKGQVIPTLNFPQMMTDAHGSFAARMPQQLFTARYLEGRFVNVEIDVFDRAGPSTEWNFSIAAPAQGHEAAGTQVVFDLASATVAVNGKRSSIPVAQPAVRVSGTLQLVGGLAGSAPHGVPGVVYAYRSSALSGRPVWTGKADASGHFTAPLGPGTYYFAGKSPRYQDGVALCRSAGAVHFTAGTSVAVAVDCQMR